MSSTTSDKPINYKELYFHHFSFRKITGNFTAAFVPSTLGCGLHGHLGLITDATTYAQISNTAYVRPTMSDSIVQNNQGAQHQIIENIGFHGAAITVFHTANHIKRTIINQIQEYLNKTVLIPSTNKDNGIPEGLVPDLMKYLIKIFLNNVSKQLSTNTYIKTPSLMSLTRSTNMLLWKRPTYTPQQRKNLSVLVKSLSPMPVYSHIP